MGRRSRPMRRSVLGSYFNDAVSRIAELNIKMAHVMVKANFTKHDVVKWIFSDDTRLALTRASHLTVGGYNGFTFEVGQQEAHVWIRFKGDNDPIHMLVPNAECVEVDEEAFQPMADVISELRVVHHNCAVVGYVLAWMDENATAGAMRYYWPSVGALAPGFDLGNCPVAYQEPYGIHKMIPLLRDAARVAAEMHMLPPDIITPNRGLSVTFQSSKFTRHGVEITAPNRDYFL